MSITADELTYRVKKLAKECFNAEYDLPVEVSGRLIRALGQFRSIKVGKEFIPMKIVIAKRLLENYDDEIIDDVIKHELCHWYLCANKKTF